MGQTWDRWPYLSSHSVNEICLLEGCSFNLPKQSLVQFQFCLYSCVVEQPKRQIMFKNTATPKHENKHHLASKQWQNNKVMFCNYTTMTMGPGVLHSVCLMFDVLLSSACRCLSFDGKYCYPEGLLGRDVPSQCLCDGLAELVKDDVGESSSCHALLWRSHCCVITCSWCA